jgi:hypothetical protein
MCNTTIRVMYRYSSLALFFLLLISCSAGSHHTSDAKLERIFYQHLSQFQSLLSDAQNDPALISVGIRDYEIAYKDQLTQPSGLLKKRWERYQGKLKELGLAMILRGENNDVSFKYDGESFFNGDSCKGYVFSQTPPKHIKPSLDNYRLSESDRDTGWFVAKPIAGHPNWYLYLFVNP